MTSIWLLQTLEYAAAERDELPEEWVKKLKPFQMDIAKKTLSALSLLKMRWGDDVNTMDDVHSHLTGAMESLKKYIKED